jgi:hypothetical protein
MVLALKKGTALPFTEALHPLKVRLTFGLAY